MTALPMNTFTLSKEFAPEELLARDLLKIVMDGATTDGSHDQNHLVRVWRNVKKIMAAEGGDLRILTAATILHDSVAVEKSSKNRARASQLSADKARQELKVRDWDTTEIDAVCHAIEAHSFTANIAANSLEAKILQDADRLDAIGAIGIARCFYVGGRLNSALYHAEDPKATSRRLDDRTYALDHFGAKLLTLADGFQTTTGQSLAASRHQRMLVFLDGLYDEILGE